MKKFLAAVLISLTLPGGAYAEHDGTDHHGHKIPPSTKLDAGEAKLDTDARVGLDGKYDHDAVEAQTETGATAHGAADASKPSKKEHHDEKATH